MAIFRQKGRKVWQSRIFIPESGKQKSFSTGTTDKNKAILIDQNLQMAHRGMVDRDRLVSNLDTLLGVDQSQNGLSILIVDTFDEYLATPGVKIAKSNKATKTAHWNKLVSWLSDTFPQVTRLDQLNRAIAFRYSDWLFENTNTGRTYNNHRSSINSILNKLMVKAGMKENPFALTPRADEFDSVSGRAWTKSEIKDLLAVTKGTEYYGASLLSLYTALRYVDCANLRWDSIKDGVIYHEPNKTKKYKTIVEIPLHATLAAYLNSLKQSSEYVFPGLHKKYPESDFTAYMYKVIDPDSKYKLSFHCWRHTCATMLVSSGVDQATRMKLGGWKNESIAEIYNHDTTALKAAIDCLPGI